MLFHGSWLLSQPSDSLQRMGSLPVSARIAAMNALDQICLVTPENTIEKYSAEGKLLARYSGNRSGMASMLDVSNPLKTLVWYADFRVVVFLDRSLVVLGELNLIQAGFPETRTLALASDGNLWLYDEVNFKLIKLTPEGKMLYESQPLNQTFPQKINITCIKEQDGRVWAVDPSLGWLEFDVYGQFQRLIAETGVTQFEVIHDYLVWIQGATLMSRHRRSFSSERRLLLNFDTKKTQIFLGARRLLVLQSGNISFFRW